MATLADMRGRIIEETLRADLSTQIGQAIQSAIETFQHERWHWAARSDYVVSINPGQAGYELDSRFAEMILARYVDAQGYTSRLLPMTWEQYREATEGAPEQSAGRPSHYAMLGDFMYLYPTSDEAGASVVLDYWRNWGVPSDDTDDSNDWMNEGERLIRWKAKELLYEEVIHDFELADRHKVKVERERRLLRAKHGRRVGAYTMPVQPWSL